MAAAYEPPTRKAASGAGEGLVHGTLGDGHQFVVGEYGPGSGSGISAGHFSMLALVSHVFVSVGL
jgi:hypothetical protein